jgi:GNAT superfamily N-acetyltransferase
MLLPTINTYQEKNKEEIINLILDIQVGEFGSQISLKDQPDLENIPAFYQKGSGNFWVAMSDNKIIGTIALIDIGNSQCALRKMFVAKEYRGKEKAVAQQLLNTLLAWCKSKKIKEIYLGTQASFFAAHRFYEKSGFVEIAKKDLPISFPIMTVDTKFYVYRFDI